MARPAKLLGFALCSALLVPAMPLARAATQNAGQLRGVGDRFLNGNGAGNQGSRQEPVTLGATQIRGFFGKRDITQIPGFLGASDLPPLIARQETGDLDLLNGAVSQVDLLPLLAEPTQILVQANNLQSEADRLFDQGLQQFNTSQYQAALESLRAALAIYREIGNRGNEGDTLNALGLLSRIAGQPQTAIDLHQQALAIAREINNRTGEVHALGNLGTVHYSQGQYERAIDFYEQALVITREFDDLAGESIIFGNLGLAYDALGHYERAIDFHGQHLAIAREIGDRAGEGRALGNLGIVYRNLGQYERAINLYQQALEIFYELGARIEQGMSLNNLGEAYRNLGQYERAIDFHEQHLVIVREIGDLTGEGNALGNLGLAYHSLGQNERAIDFFEQALSLFRKIGDRAGESRTLGNLGVVYDNLGQYDRALEQYGQAVTLFGESGVRAEEAFFLSNIGKLLNDRNQPELAIIFLKASVDVREAIRGDIRGLDTDLQQSFTDTVADDYRLLADLLLQQNRILEAQRVLDLLKVQELDDALRSVQRTSATADGVAFWEIESDLLALYSQTLEEADELAALQARNYDDLTAAEQQRLGELSDRYRDLNRRFTAFLDRPEVATLLNQIRATTDGQNLDIASQHRALQNNLRALPQKTALLYPLILPDRLELVLITADNPPLRYPIAVTGADLNRAIVAMGQALKDPGSDIQPLAQQLYGWLIAPLAPQLEQAGIESIIYAPDGALRYIPLAALHDGSQYLAERFSISHITAVSLTNLNFAPQPDQRRLLAAACAQCSFTITVGDRVFPFGDLPYTATEVNRLAEQVPNTSVLLNRRFSQTELENRLGSFNILHLATHGAVVAEAPRESFLVLGSGETVSLETIRNDWSLSAELVVLSACETAVGSTELGSGVEILGLGYQIQQAGAQAVIASLWQVSDPGTEALMAEFYAALGQGLTKTAALQAAQQALIRNQFAITGGPIRAIALPTAEDGRTLGANAAPGYSHPYYWAPFILIGNGL
jgi:CHAT domain-containing protein/tetratricopeptide (TPR) repeat protein